MALTFKSGYATYQQGVALNAEQPLDDRTVVDYVEDLYNIDTFYQRAYKGMRVTVLNTTSLTSGDVTVWVLTDNSPFTKNATSEQIDNIRNVWQQIGGGGGNTYYWYNMDKW